MEYINDTDYYCKCCIHARFVVTLPIKVNNLTRQSGIADFAPGHTVVRENNKRSRAAGPTTDAATWRTRPNIMSSGAPICRRHIRKQTIPVSLITSRLRHMPHCVIQKYGSNLYCIVIRGGPSHGYK